MKTLHIILDDEFGVYAIVLMHFPSSGISSSEYDASVEPIHIWIVK